MVVESLIPVLGLVTSFLGDCCTALRAGQLSLVRVSPVSFLFIIPNSLTFDLYAGKLGGETMNRHLGREISKRDRRIRELEEQKGKLQENPAQKNHLYKKISERDRRIQELEKQKRKLEEKVAQKNHLHRKISEEDRRNQELEKQRRKLQEDKMARTAKAGT